MEVDDDCFIVIINNEEKQKSELQSQRETTHDNQEELKEQANFERCLNIIKNQGEVPPIIIDDATKPVEEHENSKENEYQIPMEHEETQEDIKSKLYSTEILEDSSDEDNILVEVPAGKRTRPILKSYERKSFVEQLRLQYNEFDEDRKLLVETLVSLMESAKPPPPPEYFYIKNYELFECLFCGFRSKSLRAATYHYNHTHGERFLFCFGCGADYHNAPILYKHEMACQSKDRAIVLEARAIYHERRGTYAKNRNRPRTMIQPIRIKTENTSNRKEKHMKPTEDSSHSISIKQEESDSEPYIMVIPSPEERKPRKKQVKPRKRRSYIKELRSQYPELKADGDLLIETLAGIMRIVKPPPPPQDYFIMSGIMFKCTKCGVESNTMPAAARHYQHKHGTRYLVCFACGVDFMSPTDLYKHEKRCRAPDAKVMLKARARFLGNKGCSRPYLEKQKFKMSSDNVKRVRRRYVTEKYQCEQCSAAFRCKVSLQRHLNLHSGTRPYRCEYCPAAYTSNVALRRHSAKHSNVVFICDHCNRCFKLKKLLVPHMATHYQSKFECKICGNQFSQKLSLSNHMNRKHLMITPTFMCSLCQKGFWKNSSLRAHMQREHGSSLVTSSMFRKKLPILTEAELMEAKNIYSPDLTEVNDRIFISLEGLEANKELAKTKQKPTKKKKEPAKKKPAERKRKANVANKKKNTSQNDVLFSDEQIDIGKECTVAYVKAREQNDENKLRKDNAVKKNITKPKKQKKVEERDTVYYYAIEAIDGLVTVNAGLNQKCKPNEKTKKIYV